MLLSVRSVKVEMKLFIHSSEIHIIIKKSCDSDYVLEFLFLSAAVRPTFGTLFVVQNERILLVLPDSTNPRLYEKPEVFTNSGKYNVQPHFIYH